MYVQSIQWYSYFEHSQIPVLILQTQSILSMKIEYQGSDQQTHTIFLLLTKLCYNNTVQ